MACAGDQRQSLVMHCKCWGSAMKVIPYHIPQKPSPLGVRSHALGRKVSLTGNACIVLSIRTGAAPRSGSAGSAARILRIPARAGRACRRQWRDCSQTEEVLVAALSSIVSMLEPHPVHSLPCLFCGCLPEPGKSLHQPPWPARPAPQPHIHLSTLVLSFAPAPSSGRWPTAGPFG